VPFQVDRAVNIASTVYFRPAMRTARLFMPDFDEAKFFLQLRIAHNFVPQRSGPRRDYLNHGLHSRLASAGNQLICNASFNFAGDQKGPSVSAKGAHSLQSLGSAPGFSKSEAISLESATHLAASIEPRVQRFDGRKLTNVPGPSPQANLIVAPLALARIQIFLGHGINERYMT
jgi:hypothetical protein